MAQEGTGWRGRGAPPVGRDAELRALTAAIAAVQEGRGGLLWTEGVAGAGTTTLLLAGARAAVAAGVPVTTDVAQAQHATGPVVLLADDLHAAPDDVLRTLLALADRLDALPVVLLAGGRAVAPAVAPAALAALREHPAAERLVLGPLPRRCTVQLVAHHLGAAPPELADALHDLARGVPGTVVALAAAVGTGGDSVVLADVAHGVLRDVARDRLAGLPPAAAAVLDAAALLGPDARAAELADLAGVDDAALPVVLSALEVADLVRRDGQTVTLVPEQLGDALRPAGSCAATVRSCRRAARLLAARAPERAGELLLTIPAAGCAWTARTLRRAAAAAAAHGRPEAAARHLERALTEPAPPDLRGTLALELARTRAALADPGAADDFRAALAFCPPGPARAPVLHELGRAEFYGGRFAVALEAFSDALAELGDGEDREAAELRASIALTVLLAERDIREDAIARIAAHVDADHEPRFPAERVMLTVLAAHRALRVLDRPGAVALAHRAWGAGALRLEDHPELVGHLLMAVFTFADQHPTALTLADDAVVRAEASGDGPALALASYTRAQTLLRMGRVAPGAEDAARAVALAGDGWFLPAARAVLAAARLEAGHPEDALALLDAGAAAGPPQSDAWTRVVFLEQCGDCALALGRAQEAVAAYRECGRLHDEVLEAPNPAKSLWRSGLARALAQLGDHDGAREQLAAQDALAQRWGAASPLGVTRCAQGALEGGAAGIALAREGVALLAGTPLRLKYAAGLLDLGVLLREHGDQVAAREPLREALDVAEDCGSRRLAEIARAELVAAGARPRRARTSGAQALTPSERRVAAMAAEGLTNREIAEALVVTVKAVRWHLGNAYRKLGIERRDEVAAALSADVGAAPETSRA